MKTKQTISESLKKQIFHLKAYGYDSREIALRINISRSLFVIGWMLYFFEEVGIKPASA